VSISRLLVD